MKKEETKKKINIKLLIAIGLVIVAAIILCVIIFSGKENEYKDKATYSESFFIKNNKGRYALYNKKGKQLSKFIYETSSYFINGSSLVTNKNNDYAEDLLSASNANLLEDSKISANTSTSLDNSLFALILIKERKTLLSMFSSDALLSLRIRIFFFP